MPAASFPGQPMASGSVPGRGMPYQGSAVRPAQPSQQPGGTYPPVPAILAQGKVPGQPIEAPRPVAARGYSQEEPPSPAPPPRPAPVTMPSPQQMGIAAGQAIEAGVDWMGVRRQLNELGVISFQMDRLNDGSHRFVCVLPSGQPDRHRRIESRATTENEAIRLALERAQLPPQ